MYTEAISNLSHAENHSTAIIAGGCFWCVDTIFKRLKGVKRAISGYSGGTAETADYELVCSKQTKHAEAVLVDYDPSIISYEQLLKIFFTVHNPTTPNRQGNDVGPQYRSAIFYLDDEQQAIAQKVIDGYAADLWDDPIVTELSSFDTFYVAEDYHQGYFERVGNRNPYCSIVIAPKVNKARKAFAHLMQDETVS
ncbi:MAG: peptide-methionine (S)-S-oxide reductase MsrA [Bacteroidota bacterium]